MGALNLFYDSLEALWGCVAIPLTVPADRLLLKQRLQGLICAFDNRSAHVFRRFGTHELDSNRDNLGAAVRALYEESDDAAATISLMFDTPDTPEYNALTEVLVRLLAVRDAMGYVFNADSSDSDSDSDSS